MALDKRTTGLLIAFIGTMAATPDAALLRAMQMNGGSDAQITVWRYALVAAISVCIGTYNEGSLKLFVENMARSFWPMLLAAMIMVGVNVGFTLSLLKVDPAKALLLISLNPLWSAILGVTVLGDLLPTRTVIAQALSLVSMVLVFVPNVLDALSADPADEEKAAEAEGENPLMVLIPFATGVLQAAFLIFVRFTAMRRPDTSFEAVPAVGALISSLLSAASAIATGDSLTTGLGLTFWLCLGANGLGLSLYNTACVVAPRFISGAEVALVLLLETVGGPIWVFLFYGDVPNAWTLASGGLLITALVGHELAGMAEGDEVDEEASGASSLQERSTVETVRVSYVDKSLIRASATSATGDGEASTSSKYRAFTS